MNFSVHAIAKTHAKVENISSVNAPTYYSTTVIFFFLPLFFMLGKVKLKLVDLLLELNPFIIFLVSLLKYRVYRFYLRDIKPKAGVTKVSGR